MKIVVPFIHTLSADEARDWVAAIEAELPEIAVREARSLTAEERHAARVAIAANPDPREFEGLPSLRWIQSLWAGVERLVPSTPEQVAIVRMTDPQLAATMAEAVLAWTLYLHRDMPLYAAQQRQALWRQHDVTPASGRRVGILGFGNMGLTAARRLTANGFSVMGWSRTPKLTADVQTFSGADGLRAMLGAADIVVILLPLTEETRGLMNADALACMRPGASLVNFGRGAILDDTALLERLNSGALAHAVLDVFVTEPLPEESPFWRHERVTVLPHITAPTTIATASRIAAANLRSFLADGRIPEAVDRARGY